jgi:putative endonuclease
MSKTVGARRRLGNAGEELAARALRERGLEIVACNFRCESGEMDLVAREGDVLVFVEVKTRRGNRFGLPEDAVNLRKQQKLIAVAESYLQTNALDDVDWRIDVVAVQMDVHGHLTRLDVIEHAVER